MAASFHAEEFAVLTEGHALTGPELHLAFFRGTTTTTTGGLAHDPFLVLNRQVHFAVEGPRPVQTRAVVMRMRDHNGADPAVPLDCRDGVVVQVRDAVPEDVPFGRETQEGTLPDGDLGSGVDADQLTILGGQIRLVDDLEVIFVLSALLHRLQRGP